jgi:hypothetical protein
MSGCRKIRCRLAALVSEITRSVVVGVLPHQIGPEAHDR